MSEIASRLKQKGIHLPEAPAPVASYVGYVVEPDGRVTISGQLPLVAGEMHYAGQLGAEISVEDGQKAAALCAINLLAQLQAACEGELSRITRCLRLGIFVSATSDFTAHPQVANGASDLIVDILGETGAHARAAVGVSSLPLGAAVEVEGTFLIRC